jgi:hypothetical protein
LRSERPAKYGSGKNSASKSSKQLSFIQRVVQMDIDGYYITRGEGEDVQRRRMEKSNKCIIFFLYCIFGGFLAVLLSTHEIAGL